jgi:hypothetical protein
MSCDFTLEGSVATLGRAGDGSIAMTASIRDLATELLSITTGVLSTGDGLVLREMLAGVRSLGPEVAGCT